MLTQLLAQMEGARRGPCVERPGSVANPAEYPRVSLMEDTFPMVTVLVETLLQMTKMQPHEKLLETGHFNSSLKHIETTFSNL